MAVFLEIFFVCFTKITLVNASIVFFVIPVLMNFRARGFHPYRLVRFGRRI
jgi:hypothetical protein